MVRIKIKITLLNFQLHAYKFENSIFDVKKTYSENFGSKHCIFIRFCVNNSSSFRSEKYYEMCALNAPIQMSVKLLVKLESFHNANGFFACSDLKNNLLCYECKYSDMNRESKGMQFYLNYSFDCSHYSLFTVLMDTFIFVEKATKEPNTRSCSIKLTRVAEQPSQQSKRIPTRSQSKSIENPAQVETIVPSKRSSRFKSTPMHATEPNNVQGSISKRRRLSDVSTTDDNEKPSKKNVNLAETKKAQASASKPGKRRRLSDASTSGDSASSSKKKKTENDEMSQVVVLNCKLTNEVLKLKNLVLEKGNDFVKLQEQFHQKMVECISLESSLEEAKKKIDELTNAYETLKSERFCSDLIKFDDDGSQQCGMYNCLQ